MKFCEYSIQAYSQLLDKAAPAFQKKLQLIFPGISNKEKKFDIIDPWTKYDERTSHNPHSQKSCSVESLESNNYSQEILDKNFF